MFVKDPEGRKRGEKKRVYAVSNADALGREKGRVDPTRGWGGIYPAGFERKKR